MDRKSYLRLKRESIPLNQSGETEVDLFVHLPTLDKHIRYFRKGDFLDTERYERISLHVVPDLFAEEEAMNELRRRKGEALPENTLVYNQEALPENTLVYNQKKKKLKMDGLSESATEVLSKDCEARINSITSALLATPPQDPSVTLRELEKVTEEIIDLVAPEAKAIKKYLLQFTQHLEMMNNASAITTLSVMIASANGFDSTKSYKDLSFAALIMDVGMAELPEADQIQYYKDASLLSPKAKELVRNHPARSHQLAVTKLPSLSEVTLQLILTHHELYNGKGYPRGIRTESLAPIMKVLPLAVDVFDFLKRNELEDKKISLLDAFNYFLTEAPEAHLRRHNKKLVEACVNYLQQENEDESGEKKTA